MTASYPQTENEGWQISYRRATWPYGSCQRNPAPFARSAGQPGRRRAGRRGLAIPDARRCAVAYPVRSLAATMPGGGGPRAPLAALPAAALDGLRGFSDPDQRPERPIYLLRPAGALSSKERPGLAIAVHYSRHLGQDDVHPVRRPPRTRVARSLVDAAAWMGSDRGAQAVLAAGVQQRLVRVADLTAVVSQNQRLGRRGVINATLADIAGGAQALSELDFTRLLRQYRLPVPGRASAPRGPGR